jgi:hypothetical protein
MSAGYRGKPGGAHSDRSSAARASGGWPPRRAGVARWPAIKKAAAEGSAIIWVDESAFCLLPLAVRT